MSTHKQAKEPARSAQLIIRVRSRLALCLGLAGAWIFLALHREALFHAFRRGFEERTTYLIFADQMGFTHALLFCIAAATVFSVRSTSTWLIAVALGVIAAGLTVALARVGYPFNLVDTFQSMAIRSIVYLLLIHIGTKRFLRPEPANPVQRPLTIADALLMTLVAAVFMASIRGELGYFRRVAMIDLMYIRDDVASLAQFTLEASVESGIGVLWFVLLQSRRSLAISIAAVFAATVAGSVISTLAYKLYRLYQFSEPSQIRTIQDTFQIHLPSLLAFATWFCLLGLALRQFGVFPATRLAPTKDFS